MSMIKIDHLRKEYPNVTPLKDVNIEIHKGDVISVIGPSGTGKSTLLRCLNRLEEPTGGMISVDGEVITSPDCDIARVRRKMGMVFQSFNLFNIQEMKRTICRYFYKNRRYYGRLQSGREVSGSTYRPLPSAGSAVDGVRHKMIGKDNILS